MPSNEHLYAPAGPASAAKSDPRSDSSPSAAIDNHATTAPAGQASPRLTDTLSSSTTAVPAGVRPMRVEGVRRRSLTFLSRFSRRFSGRQESASSLYGQAPCVGDLSRVDTDFILREQSDRVIRELRDLTTSHREQTGVQREIARAIERLIGHSAHGGRSSSSSHSNRGTHLQERRSIPSRALRHTYGDVSSLRSPRAASDERINRPSVQSHNEVTPRASPVPAYPPGLGIHPSALEDFVPQTAQIAGTSRGHAWIDGNGDTIRWQDDEGLTDLGNDTDGPGAHMAELERSSHTGSLATPPSEEWHPGEEDDERSGDNIPMLQYEYPPGEPPESAGSASHASTSAGTSALGLTSIDSTQLNELPNSTLPAATLVLAPPREPSCDLVRRLESMAVTAPWADRLPAPQPLPPSEEYIMDLLQSSRDKWKLKHGVPLEDAAENSGAARWRTSPEPGPSRAPIPSRSTALSAAQASSSSTIPPGLVRQACVPLPEASPTPLLQAGTESLPAIGPVPPQAGPAGIEMTPLPPPFSSAPVSSSPTIPPNLARLACVPLPEVTPAPLLADGSVSPLEVAPGLSQLGLAGPETMRMRATRSSSAAASRPPTVPPGLARRAHAHGVGSVPRSEVAPAPVPRTVDSGYASGSPGGTTRSASPEDIEVADNDADDDRTHACIHGFDCREAPFPGQQLYVHVGSKRDCRRCAHGGEAKLLDEALRHLLRLCKDHRHDLTQLKLKVFHSQVRGGAYDTCDSLLAVLMHLEARLACFHSIDIEYAGRGKGVIQALPDLHRICATHTALSGLQHLKLWGHVDIQQVLMFPLAQLRHLEIYAGVSEQDLTLLMHKCETLDVLIISCASTTQAKLKEVLGDSAVPAAVHFPPVMHITAEYLNPVFLLHIPSTVHLRLSMSKDSYTGRHREICESGGRREAWSVKLN